MPAQHQHKKSRDSIFGTKAITKKEVNEFYKKLNSFPYSYPLRQRLNPSKETHDNSFKQTSNAGV